MRENHITNFHLLLLKYLICSTFIIYCLGEIANEFGESLAEDFYVCGCN